MSEKKTLFTGILKSVFMRSVITRVLAIFIVVSVIIAVTAFFSFASELRKSMLLDRYKQLSTVENTISARMDEINSIAFSIGKDPLFFLEPVNDLDSEREMSKTLERYLVGNSFIEHLAYCRSAEPDKIYVCTGVRSLKEFFTTSFGVDEKTAEWTIQQIIKENKTSIRASGEGKNAYFSYNYPLPQLADNPRAHVLIMIPIKEVSPLLEALFINDNGAAFVFDADGKEIYGLGNLKDALDVSDFVKSSSSEENYRLSSGQDYVLQKVVSETNNWTYVLATLKSDTLPGLAGTQIAFIVFVILLFVATIVIILASIISQYKPISNLAAQVAEDGRADDARGKIIDERALLSDTIATLRDDSEQKQKYETAFNEAEAASKAKSAFLSSMSHDIRTPMNAIIGMTAIARKHIGDQAYVDECLKKVQVSSDYLLDIINNVLDMSRIESGRIPIAEEPVVIPALIDSVVSLMTSAVEAKNQTLNVDIGELERTTVLGDNIHLVQVFVNILSNAVKFTLQGGTISLSVRQNKSSDERFGNYTFAFSDNGIGIPPEFISHVFDTFSRASEPASSTTQGTGLGMAIAKKLVELMGGSIKCESDYGNGTTFTVIMHMKYAKDEKATEYASDSAMHRENDCAKEGKIVNLTGKRILLVEDNAMNREIAKSIISETGVAITEANDGKVAVDAFLNNPEGYFNLIFMDIQMPVINGYDAAKAIRSSGRADAGTVKIYAMTANTFDEDVRQVMQAGMNGHIGKPYYPEKLYDLLAHVLG